ncbi:hypothetical protein [Cucumibacter marinus]|uniref:hypothetical protein n=1 Tax=Cucumibacter marinus TaxID=1121252 RepID=UPI0003F4EEE0|nr:hypothetical protein [Cucumibacter marinus]
MADNKQPDDKQTGKAQQAGKSGAVKPPTLDMTAKSSDKPADAPKTGEPGRSNTMAGAKRKAAERQSPATSSSTGSTASTRIGGGNNGGGAGRSNTGASGGGNSGGSGGGSGGGMGGAVTGTVLGGILGLGLAYGAATLGFWPQDEVAPNPDLGNLIRRVNALENAPAPAGPNLSAYVKQADLDTLRTSLATMAEAQANAASRAELTALGDQLDALSARLPDGDAALVTEADLATIGAAVEAMANAPRPGANLESGLAELQSGFDTLEQRIAALEAAPVPQPASNDTADDGARALDSDLEARIEALEARAETPAPAEGTGTNSEDLAELQARLDTLQGDVTRLNETTGALGEGLAALALPAESAPAGTEDTDTADTGGSRDLTALNDQLGALNTRIDALEAAREAEGARDLETAPAASNAEVAAIGTSLDQLGQVTASLGEGMTALDTRLSALDGEIEELRNGLKTQSARALETPAASSADVEAMGTSLDQLGQMTASLGEGMTALETRLTGLDSEIAGLRETLTADVAANSGSLSAEAGRIDTLDAKLTTLSRGLAEAETMRFELTAQAERIAAAEQDIASLRTDLDTIQQNASQAREAARALEVEAEQKAALAAALGELDTRVKSGSSFAPELTIVADAVPAVELPETVTAIAETGLTPLPTLSARLADAAPAMLQALATSRDDPDLMTRLTDQLAASIALRPEGEPEGDDPLSVMARLESALRDGSIFRAQEEFQALPAPMQAEAIEIGIGIDQHVALSSYLNRINRATSDSQGR